MNNKQRIGAKRISKVLCKGELNVTRNGRTIIRHRRQHTLWNIGEVNVGKENSKRPELRPEVGVRDDKRSAKGGDRGKLGKGGVSDEKEVMGGRLSLSCVSRGKKSPNICWQGTSHVGKDLRGQKLTGLEEMVWCPKSGSFKKNASRINEPGLWTRGVANASSRLRKLPSKRGGCIHSSI